MTWDRLIHSMVSIKHDGNIYTVKRNILEPAFIQPNWFFLVANVVSGFLLIPFDQCVIELKDISRKNT